MKIKRRIFKESIIERQSKKVETFWRDSLRGKYSEVIVYGPTDCAKTFECLCLMHYLCATVPNFQCVILRKAKTTIYSTALPTLKHHILPYGLIDCQENLIVPYGGQNTPQWLDYKETGSRMWFLGEDDKTGKALGTEWDGVLYSQAEFASAEFWEQLTGRCTGRAGNWIPIGHTTTKGICLGECNPASDKHFLRNRLRDGRCFMYKFLHVDSPKIYIDGEYTKYGKENILEGLKNKYTGHLYERLYLGNWVGVSGAVYAQEYDPNKHDIEESTLQDLIQSDWEWSVSMDFGFQHPFVCSLFVGPAERDEDGKRTKLYHYKEAYKTGLTPEEMTDYIQQILAYIPKGKKPKWIVGDHKPELHKALEQRGVPIKNAEKHDLVIPGIQLVKEALIQDKLYFNKDSLIHAPDQAQRAKGYPTRSVEEFSMYAYKPEEKLTGALSDEIPESRYNDFCDALRYEIVEWVKPKLEYVSLHTVSPMTAPDIF